ncbi:hypothetical protein KI688_003074 [Linnemannia hyalina]|uniref:F-box domain-containing protein n=1 Tax=Linnemannia hyalina TaxID=64524 RepID=A0A9P7XRU1_9FUNG|nr:hypothetical protein KI688_003074 [Linnemannia hyalina]
MEPISMRVFGLPELASIIASSLDKKTLTQVMVTNRRMHAAFELWFYRDLRTLPSSSRDSGASLCINLCDSPDGLRALSRNIHFVRSWETDLFNLVFISHATAAIQQYFGYDSNGSTNNRNGNNKELDAMPMSLSSFLTWTKGSLTRTRRPRISSVTTLGLLLLIPLPPVMSLSRLKLSLPSTTNSNQRSRSHTLPNHTSLFATIAHLCVALQHLPQLRELALDHLSVKDPWSIRPLTSTLSRMNHLRRLELDVYIIEGVCGVGLSLFFGCPPSVEKLRIQFHEYEMHYSETGSSDESSLHDVEDALIEAVATATTESLSRGSTSGTLANLRDINLEACLDDATLEEYLSIFESCPNLKTLELMEITFPDGLDGADIGRMCPHLRNLRFDGAVEMTGDRLWPLGIMETLPRDRMEILNYYGGGPDQWLDATVVGKTLLRHSCSLREFHACSRTASAAMRMILATCEALEVLEICCSSIDLADAVGSPWASSKLKSLSLDIKITLLSLSLPAGTPYVPSYLKTPPAQLTKDEKYLFTQLEFLYQQIGKQEDLKVLQLSRAECDEYGASTVEADKRNQPFPGLLRLGDGSGNSANSINGDIDRPGFLHLLGKLSKLEVVVGEICPEAGDRKMPANSTEAEWIRTHWPLLRETHFSFVSEGSEETSVHV